MQAVLILAHTAPDHVIRLSKMLREQFEVYIHFDSKTPLADTHTQQLEALGVHYYKIFDVKWGSFSIVNATKFLMEKALDNPEITHLHVISGQCWPVKDTKTLYDFYEDNANIYMECYSADGVKKSGEPIILWQKCYFNYDKVNRRTTFGKIYHRLILAGQVLLRVNKFPKLHVHLDIYHGSQWMDLPRDAAKYLLTYCEENPNVQKIFETGFCSDEFWAQTILYNSHYKKPHRFRQPPLYTLGRAPRQLSRNSG